MVGNPIMVVSLCIAPEKEAAFNEFYHHQFLPAMLESVSEIGCIRRYEELRTGETQGWYNKQFLTIYELAATTDLNKVDEFFSRPALKTVMEEFQLWKIDALYNFSRITYKESWCHERKPWDGSFGNRPLMLWLAEMKSDLNEEFQTWYENEYLATQIADIPTWTAVRRYASVNLDPPRSMTVFESLDESTLMRSVAALDSAYRINANYEWQRQVESAANWHNSTSFRPIFRKPG